MAHHTALPSEKPSRIVLAGDWHGDTEHATSVVRWASERGADGILQLGDFGIWAGRDGEYYLRQLNHELGRHGMWLGFVDGNHENFDLLERLPVRRGVRPVKQWITHLPRGYRWTWGSATWLALGGAVSMDAKWRKPRVDWWPQEAITIGQAMKASAEGPAHYMLCHDAPDGVDVPGLLDVWPADAVRAANRHREQLRTVVELVEPYAVIHGHMHARYAQTKEFTPDKPTKVVGLASNHEPFSDNVLLVDLDVRGFIVWPPGTTPPAQ